MREKTESEDRFPLTRYSAIRALSSDDNELRTRAWNTLVSAYWKPVYKYIRVKWKADTDKAQDLSQGFFITALEKEYLQRYDPNVARFRTFLRTCLDRYVMNERAAESRLKRGGEATFLSLDFASAERELSANVNAAGSPDKFFDEEWVREVFSLALSRLKQECVKKEREVHFKLFHQYDIEQGNDERRLTYQQLANEFGVSLTDVTNYLALARREFRACVLAVIGELTATDEEYREEVRSLLGAASG